MATSRISRLTDDLTASTKIAADQEWKDLENAIKEMKAVKSSLVKARKLSRRWRVKDDMDRLQGGTDSVLNHLNGLKKKWQKYQGKG